VKFCKKCNIQKELICFYKNSKSKDGLQYRCKDCASKVSKEWEIKNRENRKISRKKFFDENPDCKQRHVEKIKMWNKNNKQRIKTTAAAYYQKNKNKINQNVTLRYQKETKLRINMIFSVAIRRALNGNKNKKHWEDLVGYTVNDLILHLESKFTKGMNWKNYGKNGWEVDHIIPQYYFNYKDYSCKSFKVCWSLNNLQPLWSTTKIAIQYGEKQSYIGNREKNKNIKIDEYILKIINDAHN
jgi:hypothetical protein